MASNDTRMVRRPNGVYWVARRADGYLYGTASKLVDAWIAKSFDTDKEHVFATRGQCRDWLVEQCEQ